MQLLFYPLVESVHFKSKSILHIQVCPLSIFLVSSLRLREQPTPLEILLTAFMVQLLYDALLNLLIIGN